MNYQNETLPKRAIKAGSTPSMTEETVVPGILNKHLAPKGKFGYLVVEEGSLQFVWEDEEDNIFDADSEHPIVIFPERYENWHDHLALAHGFFQGQDEVRTPFD